MDVFKNEEVDLINLEKNKLDFICIGAQKSGTTYLFKMLKQHPQIFLPEVKEAPYYTEPDLITNGWNKYFEKHFQNSNASQLIGTISPQYMYHPSIAKKIFLDNNDIKIIILLRNPIERIISHYKMNLIRGIENRSFTKMLNEEMDDSKLKVSRTIIPTRFEVEAEMNTYLVWGEYHRILSEYYSIFPYENIFICSADELFNNSTEILRHILSFLCLNEDFCFRHIEVRFHESRYNEFRVLLNKIKKNITKIFPIINDKNDLLINQIRKLIKIIKEQESEFRLKNKDKNKLVQFYKNDIAKLETLTNSKFRWKEFE